MDNISVFYKAKNALITGGSSGIGLAIAQELAKYGCGLTLIARDPVKLNAAKTLLDNNPLPRPIDLIQADVSDSAELSRVIDDYYSRNPVPNLIFNSAGFSHPGEFSTQSIELFRQQMDINFFGVVNTLKPLVPKMIEQHSGHIVNISSAVGFLNIYGYTGYGASKFAVTGLTEALRMELKPHGIHVHLAIPSDVKTPQLEYENQFKPDVTREINKVGGLSEAKDVAHEILDGVAHGKYLILPGKDVKFLYRALMLLGKPFFFNYLDRIVANTLKKRS